MGSVLASADQAAPRFLGVDDGNRLVFMLRHQRTTGVVVQLIAANNGEGTSTLTRDLALIAARIPGMRVLLLDLDPSGDAQLAALRNTFGLSVTASRQLGAIGGDMQIHQLDDGNLHVSDTRQSPPLGPSAYASLFAQLRSEFPLVLVDSPAVEHSYDGVILARDVDTSLLVVEAEKTRSGVAQNLRDRILDAGGHIGGVVMNKRRFHIPGFIYRRL